jgi:hypothetical protein
VHFLDAAAPYTPTVFRRVNRFRETESTNDGPSVLSH